MRKGMLGTTVLALLLVGCTSISRRTPPSLTAHETEPAAVTALASRSPAATATLEPTRTWAPTPSARASALPTWTAPPIASASPTATPSVVPSRTASATTTLTATSSRTLASTPDLPQEVTTVMPQASWPYVSSLVVTPNDPPDLYAVIESELYRSGDRAQSWQYAETAGIDSAARIAAVAVDYRHPDTMYLMTSGGIYRREGAQPWAFVHPLNALALAVDLLDSNTLWAGVPYSTEYDAMVLKSTDRGRTWARADAGMFGGLGGGVSAIVIDPNDPNILFANTRYAGRFGWPVGGLFRGGRNGHWEQLDVFPQWESGCLPNGMAFDPNLRRIYIGCDAYYYNERKFVLRQSDNATAANSAEIAWENGPLGWPVQADLAFGAVRPLAVDARQPKTIYVAITEYTATESRHALLTSHDDGATWQRLPLP